MNVWSGLALLAVALVLILLGLPKADGMHRKFLRFDAAMVLYPPLILTFLALGAAAVVSSLG